MRHVAKPVGSENPIAARLDPLRKIAGPSVRRKVNLGPERRPACHWATGRRSSCRPWALDRRSERAHFIEGKQFQAGSGRSGNPKQSISGTEFELAGLPVEQGELMSERQILQREPEMGLEAGEQAPQKCQKDIDLDGANFGRPYCKINIFGGLWSFRYPQR